MQGSFGIVSGVGEAYVSVGRGEITELKLNSRERK